MEHFKEEIIEGYTIRTLLSDGILKCRLKIKTEKDRPRKKGYGYGQGKGWDLYRPSEWFRTEAEAKKAAIIKLNKRKASLNKQLEEINKQILILTG